MQRGAPPSAQPVRTVTTNSSSASTGNRYLNFVSVGKFNNLPTLFPDKMLVKLKYTDNINYAISQSSALTVQTGYRLNSVFSPSLSNSTQQTVPGFYDLSQIYNSYRVHATKMTCDIENINSYNGSASVGFLVLCTMTPEAQPAYSPATQLQSLGNPYTVWANLGLGGSEGGRAVLENYVSLQKLWGSSSQKIDNDFAASTAGSPAQLLFGYVYLIPLKSGTTTINATQIITLDFWVEFYNRQFELT